jgi:hypothetical protein
MIQFVLIFAKRLATTADGKELTSQRQVHTNQKSNTIDIKQKATWVSSLANLKNIKIHFYANSLTL